MDSREEGRRRPANRNDQQRTRFSSQSIVRHGPARRLTVVPEEYKDPGVAPLTLAIDNNQAGRPVAGHFRRHQLEFTFNQLTENDLQRQLQQFRMVKCIDRTGPGNMMKSPLMELCERIDQSRRVALDCSDLGADLIKAIASTKQSPAWKALSFKHIMPTELCSIFSQMRQPTERDAVTFTWGPLAGTTWTYRQLWAQRQSEEMFKGVLWYNVHMEQYYRQMTSGALSAEEALQFPTNLPQMMCEYQSALYILGFPGLDATYKTTGVSLLPPHIAELPKEVWLQLLHMQASLELSETQVGRLKRLLQRQQRDAREFQMSIACMEDVLEETHEACRLRGDAAGWNPWDLQVQNAYAALKEGRQKQRISEIKASCKIMFNILTPFQASLLKCELEFNLVRQPLQDWGDWMRLFHIILHHCG